MATGVYTAYKKDGTEYYRTSLTYKNKHISLGSFTTYDAALAVYQEGLAILSDSEVYCVNADTAATGYDHCSSEITFEKYIILCNFRDHQMYFKSPIYLCKNYFMYFIKEHTVLKFDVDDLFYYANHRIAARGGYYYVNDYGMQTSILTRYGIRSHSAQGRDYLFRNGDVCDYRYHNILVVNQYYGVRRAERKGRVVYITKIHINGDYIVGIFATETEAAIAYNKAADSLKDLVAIEYPRNYIEALSSIEYAAIYNKILFQKKFRVYRETLSLNSSL